MISGHLNNLLRFFSTLGAFALIAISLLISTDVTLRWATGHSIVGVFEISSVLLVMATFLPLGLVLFRHEQLRVDIIFEWVHGRRATALEFIDAAVGLVVFGILFWVGTGEFAKAYEGRFLLRGMIEIPTWIPLAMICAGAALVVLTLVFQAVDSLLRLMGKRASASGVETETPADI